jgi:WD40 repeat protein
VDGHTLATAGVDKTVLLWDVTDPTRPRRLGDPLTGDTDAVYGVAFAPDGHRLATSSLDKTVLLWDVSDPTRPDPAAPARRPADRSHRRGVRGGVRP